MIAKRSDTVDLAAESFLETETSLAAETKNINQITNHVNTRNDDLAQEVVKGSITTVPMEATKVIIPDPVTEQLVKGPGNGGEEKQENSLPIG